jgi:hypothetical protein
MDLDGKQKEMKKTAKELDDFVQVWLDQHKRNKKPAGGKLGEFFFSTLLFCQKSKNTLILKKIPKMPYFFCTT